ncbi:SMC-Scp complex subunit ScpB [Thermodesulfovibrio hydrogeniphilus]
MHLFKDQIKSIIEALLFVSEKPISIKILQSLLNISERDIKEIIQELMDDYKLRNGGIIIINIEDSYQMVTNPEYGEWVKIFKKLNNSNKLSEQALETLAIIAYKQPITKAEIEKIRGVNSDYAIKTLLEKKLIKIVGKKEVPGRPFMYGTTKEFLKLFGISSLKELPELSQFEKINVA